MHVSRRQGQGYRLQAIVLLALLLVPASLRAGARRIVAIGDIHGAFDAFVGILGEAGLIDERHEWIGDGARLVQTGDFTDRGSRVREVMELLLELERQAEQGPGEVHLLLGNHEVMNLLGDDRDVLENPDIYASFVGDRSEARRQEAYDDWLAWRDRQRATLERLAERVDIEIDIGVDLRRFLDQSREEWMETHPAGLVEYREAFDVEGRYGAWIRRLPMVARLDDNLFLHGGISSDFAKMSAQQINALHWKRLEEWDGDRAKLVKRGQILPFFSWVETRMALELQLRAPESTRVRNLARTAWDRLNQLLDEIGSEQSPLWFRGYAESPRGLDDTELAALLDRTDKTHGVRRTITAHTPISGRRIVSRLGGRLFLIDTGMLKTYYGGRASALQIAGDEVSMIYVEPEAEATDARLGPSGRTGVAEPVLVASAGNRLAPAEDAPAAAERRIFLGPDGQPLSIQDLDELERFLLSASILSSTPLDQGTTGAQRLLLEADGVRARAIFHTVDEQRGGPRDRVVLRDGIRLLYFRDSYRSHMATYKLARLMKLDGFPPTVIRTVDETDGSLTLWIEGGENLTEWREHQDGDPRTTYFNRQIYDQRVLDNLIDNTDRNAGNIFWTGEFDLWQIDHTRSMARSPELFRPDQLTRCSQGLLKKIEQLDPEAVRVELEPYLNKYEIKALLTRREKLLAAIRKNIESMGESKVLFEYGGQLPIRIENEAA